MTDALLQKESKKESTFFSKELEDMLDQGMSNSANKDIHYAAVFKERIVVIDYIKLTNKLNRVKLKGICDCISAKELLTKSPESIDLIYKGSTISTFSIKNKVCSFSVKKNKENSYIITYEVTMED